jgi:multiple sugar transport system permease protein
MTEDVLPAARAPFLATAVRAAAAQLARYAALLALLCVIVFPVYWLVLTSLKQQRDFFTAPPIFFTSELTLEHYGAVLSNPLNRGYFANTAIVAVLSTIFATFTGTLSAYVLARIRLPFRLNHVLLIWILINRLFPPITLVIPYYLLLRRLGLIDTLPALIITYTATATPFVVWIMLTFFQDLPKEIERAAMVDGCSMWQRFRLVVLPMSFTSMTVTGMFVFMAAWNELLYALTLTALKARTVPVAIAGFVGDNALAWGQMSAFSVLSFIPVLLTTLAVQKYLVRGITFGAVKG